MLSSLEMDRYKEVVRRASTVFGPRPAAILGKSREQGIVRARQAVIFSLVANGETYARVGEFFRQDHTSIAHSHRQITYLLRTLNAKEKGELEQRLCHLAKAWETPKTIEASHIDEMNRLLRYSISLVESLEKLTRILLDEVQTRKVEKSIRKRSR